jgi:DNA-binding MarR family transcriptional regulator
MSEAKRQAKQILEVIPLLMCRIRGEMREAAPRELTVPQFRILAYLSGNPQVTSSELAAHQGVSLPAMSKAVDGLVKRGYLQRLGHGQDRRKVSLGLSAAGRRLFLQSKSSVEERISKRLAKLGPSGLSALEKALGLLEKLI